MKTTLITSKFLWSLIITSLMLWSISSHCPATDFYHPCQCLSTSSRRYELIISCCGKDIDDLSLMRAFTRLNTYLNGSMSSKVFLKLDISQTSIQNLYVYEMKLFKDLKFRKISIVDNALENFDPYVFWNSYRMNRHFSLKGHKALVNYNRRDPLPILNRFKRLEVLSITDTNYDKISKLAFSRSEQHFLKKIVLRNNEITQVESCAFFSLPNLCVLDLSHNRIRKIFDLSFAIKQPSTQRLTINLHSNNISVTSLSRRSFFNANRPLFIILSDNLLSYLDEEIFRPLLLDSNDNTVVISYNPLVCDCRFQWVVSHKHKLRTKILGQPLCHDGRSVWDYSVEDLKSC